MGAFLPPPSRSAYHWASRIHVTRPSTTRDGLHAPALAFGDPRVMALLTCLVHFSHVLAGFTNPQLVELMASLWDQPYSSRQATYDLRRLRRKGLMTRLPRSQRYQLTGFGRRVAVLFTKAHNRVLTPGLALLDPSSQSVSPNAARWPAHGNNWTWLSTTSSTLNSWPPKLD